MKFAFHYSRPVRGHSLGQVLAALEAGEGGLALLLVERERPRTEDLKSHTLQMEKTMSSLVAFLESTWNEDDCDTSERYEIV